MYAYCVSVCKISRFSFLWFSVFFFHLPGTSSIWPEPKRKILNWLLFGGYTIHTYKYVCYIKCVYFYIFPPIYNLTVLIYKHIWQTTDLAKNFGTGGDYISDSQPYTNVRLCKRCGFSSYFRFAVENLFALAKVLCMRIFSYTYREFFHGIENLHKTQEHIIRGFVT